MILENFSRKLRQTPQGLQIGLMLRFTYLIKTKIVLEIYGLPEELMKSIEI